MEIRRFKIREAAFGIHMPTGAKVLAVDVIDGQPWLWAFVDGNAPVTIRLFAVFLTGEVLPPDIDGIPVAGFVHVGMFRLEGREFHLFDAGQIPGEDPGPSLRVVK